MTVSSLGDWLGVFALTLFVQNLTHRTEFAIGGVLFFRVLPGLIFGPFAGVLTDRFDRRKLMVTADLIRAGLIVSIPWIHHLYALFLVSAVMEVLSLLWTPGKDATVPNLVEPSELLTANQLSLITTYGTFPLSGILVSTLSGIAALLAHLTVFHVLKNQPSSLAFFVDSASFLFSARIVWSMPAELMRARRARSEFNATAGIHELAEGLRYVRSRRVIRSLVLGAWAAFSAGSAVISLGPIFASANGGSSSAAQGAAWGALITAVGFGLVGGMIGAGPLAKRFKEERIAPAGLMLGGVVVILIAAMTSIRIALVLTFFAGAGAGLAWVSIFTLLQQRVDERLRGRVFATLYTGVQLSLFLSLAAWPILAALVGNHHVDVGSYRFDLAGYRIALWVGGALFALSGVFAARGLGTSLPRRRRAAARLRGLALEPRPVSGGSRRGAFIVFEGVEGSGKTTQMKLLYDSLVERGQMVSVTREPGGTAISERIRGLVLDPGAKGMDAKTEALLYAASRAQHAAEVIRPALERGDIVLCDRYVDSSLAYQGVARGLGIDDVLRLNVWGTDELLPDLVVLLNLDAATGLSRTRGIPDRIEQEGIDFHRKVGAAYLELARIYPSRYVVVDASLEPEKVQAEVQDAVSSLLTSVQP